MTFCAHIGEATRARFDTEYITRQRKAIAFGGCNWPSVMATRTRNKIMIVKIRKKYSTANNRKHARNRHGRQKTPAETLLNIRENTWRILAARISYNSMLQDEQTRGETSRTTSGQKSTQHKDTQYTRRNNSL